MNTVLKALPLFLVLLGSCNKDEQSVPISEELQKIMDIGVTVDSVGIDYAKIFTSQDGFPVIEPSSVDHFIGKDEAIIYFKFVSHSREALVEYYAKLNDENLKKGFIVDYGVNYFDKLENISIEVKKNDNEFSEINSDLVDLKFIPTPEINSGHTFAKYEMTLQEFLTRYDDSFPESFIFLFADNDLQLNTYVFKITYKLNNNKEFIGLTDPITF